MTRRAIYAKGNVGKFQAANNKTGIILAKKETPIPLAEEKQPILLTSNFS